MGVWPALQETARFVMFKRPFEEAVNTKNLFNIDKADSIHKTESYRVYPIKQETLLEEGWEDVGADPCVCLPLNNSTNIASHCRPQKKGNHRGVAPTISLSDIVHRFKSFTTSQYRINVLHNNWPSFPGKLWQRNYYEHIIRNETELNKIREYIINNPLNWESDENYR